MKEVDDCPVCNTTCEVENEFGKVIYATCETCKTRWRRRDDREDHGKMMYEKWACRIPETKIPFPFVGGGIKLREGWCRWKKIKERRIPVRSRENGMQSNREEKTFEETVSLAARECAFYDFKLSKGGKVKGEVHSDTPVDVLFLDEENSDKFDRGKRFEEADSTEGVYEAKLDFTASKKGLWSVAIDNRSKTRTKVKVHLYSSKSS